MILIIRSTTTGCAYVPLWCSQARRDISHMRSNDRHVTRGMHDERGHTRGRPCFFGTYLGVHERIILLAVCVYICIYSQDF